MLGMKIREARKSANLSQSQLATKIGAHFTSVSDWERGRNAPSARHLLSIAEVTGTDLSHFTEDEEDEEADAMTELADVLRRFVRAEIRKAA